MSRTLETFDVEEKPSAAVESQCPNVRVIQAFVTTLRADEKVTEFVGVQNDLDVAYII